MQLVDKPALLLIDIQQGFDDLAYWGGQRNNIDAEANAGRLLAFWREKSLPIFHIQHCSTNPNSRLAAGQKGHDFKEIVRPIANELVIQKQVNSGFIGTNLQQHLDNKDIKILVIVGLTTDHCVSTTARMAGNLGYQTFVVHDAVATFNKIGIDGTLYSAELIHETALASLKDEFAHIVATNDLLNSLTNR